MMSKVAIKAIPYPCNELLLVLNPSLYAILCIEQVSTIDNDNFIGEVHASCPEQGRMQDFEMGGSCEAREIFGTTPT